MKLPIPFLNKKSKDKGYYLALILDDEKTSSVILEEKEGKLKIAGKHTEHFELTLETIPQDELITLIDRTISKAEEVLPPNIETHKTIFGVKENWVENESKNKKEYLTKLKKVCDALDLNPIGFIVINEAIANLLAHEEGSPLSAILVELGKKTVHVTLFRGGKISESTSGPIEHSIPRAVDILLRTFTAAVLPTKILLFHAKDAKELSHHFINHEWSKSLPFLHPPQVSVLPKDYDTTAVTYGAGQQMGFEVLGLLGKNPVDENAVKKDVEIQEEKNAASVTPPLAEPGNFGFVQDEDIAKHPVKEKVSEIASNEDIEQSQAIHPQKTEEKFDEEHNVNLRDTSVETSSYESIDANQPKTEKQNMFAGALGILPQLSFPKIKGVSDFFTKNKRLKLPIIIIGAILIFVVAFALFYFYSVKAQIVLSVKPNVVTQEENVTFSASAGNDFSKNIISAKSISTSIDGELSTPTTGKKDTGDKAKGSVTIYNSDNSPAALSTGTEIKSSNGTSFTLDKDVKLASASGDIFTGTKPGTATVTVTAKNIGTESNLPSNTKFAIGGNGSLAGKNDSAFSGGTKKAITVVSKADIAKLRAELPKKLEKDAINKLMENKDNDLSILPGFVKSSITDEDFDKNIDDEAKQVKLIASVKFDGMGYQNDDLENFDKSILKDKYSQDISFADKSLKNEVKETKAKSDNEIFAKLRITAGLLPKIDNNEIVNKIKEKSPKDAKEILDSLPQVSKSEIKFFPNISIFSILFPRLPMNISVTVKPNE